MTESDPRRVDELDDLPQGDEALGGDIPPDHPQGLTDYGVLGADQTYPEPFEERIDRDDPDDGSEPVSVGIQLEGGGLFDDEGSMVADGEVEVVRSDDDPALPFVDRYATAADRAPQAAEEAAMHLEEE